MYWFGVAALKRTANGLRAQRTPISHLGRPGGANTSHLWSNFISSFSNFHPACFYVACFHFSTLPIFSQNIFTVFNQSLLLLLHTFILSSLGLMRHFFKIFVILLIPPLVTYFDKRTIWHPNNLAPGQLGWTFMANICSWPLSVAISGRKVAGKYLKHCCKST